MLEVRKWLAANIGAANAIGEQVRIRDSCGLRLCCTRQRASDGLVRSFMPYGARQVSLLVRQMQKLDISIGI